MIGKDASGKKQDRGSAGLDVKETITRLRKQLDEMKKTLQSELSEGQDDLYLLRFLLSHHESVEEAISFYRKSEVYRKENAEWMKADVPPNKEEVEKVFILDTGSHTQHGDPIFLAKSGLTMSNLKKQKDPYPLLKLFEKWSVWQKERIYLECDQLSRKTGRLHKMFFVNDMKGLAVLTDPRILKAFGSSSKISEIVHPQLVEKQIIVHPPALVRIMFTAMKPFLSKNILEKTVICTNSNKKQLDFSDCPFVQNVVGVDYVPTTIKESREALLKE